MASKSTKAAENVCEALVMVPLGQGNGHLLAKEYIIMDRLISILTHLSKFPLDRTFNVRGFCR